MSELLKQMLVDREVRRQKPAKKIAVNVAEAYAPWQ